MAKITEQHTTEREEALLEIIKTAKIIAQKAALNAELATAAAAFFSAPAVAYALGVDHSYLTNPSGM